MKNVFVGALLLIQACLATAGQLDESKDYATSGCQNFSISSLKNEYLPSDVISIMGSCETSQDKEVLCPSWNITSTLVEVKFLRNQTVQNGTECTRTMEVQVVTLNNSDQRVRLLVEFQHPRSEPIKEINVKRSDDGEFCRQSRDCYYSDQFCSTSGECTCSDRWVFIRNIQQCFPGISRVKAQCRFTEQCLIPNSNCDYTRCECEKFYIPSSGYTRCVPEAKGYQEYCVSDENCQLKSSNTTCKNNYCACKPGYTYNYDSTDKRCISNGGAPFKVGFGWWTTVFIVIFKVLQWS